jgi:hypothetical protein
MTYVKLVHVNPKLNEKTMWYRLIDNTNPDWYFATIWGPQGMISSKLHAVLRSEYVPVQIHEKEVQSADEFI